MKSCRDCSTLISVAFGQQGQKPSCRLQQQITVQPTQITLVVIKLLFRYLEALNRNLVSSFHDMCESVRGYVMYIFWGLVTMKCEFELELQHPKIIYYE
ncbi:hypothetical protein Hamer_G019671 [Homarus americanus]|uniref:Uncharacterized protein n=1 Tax=Homarus americanus TaxID=6706 RepID=A0A8J5JD61_HOMAM|nr:hypothetical protein Hamer_G019671 [Homarus americanus]